MTQEDVLLPDVELTIDKLARLKKILQGDQQQPPASSRSRLRSRPGRETVVEASNVDKTAFSRKVIDSAFKTLDSIKQGSAKISDKTCKYVYEAGSVALGVLYDEAKTVDSRKDYGVEKLHSNFILKLIDIDLTDEALIELWALYTRLPTGQRISPNSRPAYENLLKAKIPRKASDGELVNIVVTSQVLLLKCAQKCAQLQYKPVSNLVIANSCRETTLGPVSWCNLLPEAARASKLTLIAKLMLTLSNTSSLVTAMHMRTVALKIIPQVDSLQYYTMLLHSFDALKKQKSELEIVKQFGQDIIGISEKHISTRRSESFTRLLEHCNRVALNTKDPQLSVFWNYEPAIKNDQIKGISQVVKTFENVRSDSNETIFSGMIRALPISDHCSDPVLHKALYGLGDRLLKDGRPDLFYLMLECYSDNLEQIPSNRYPARVLELFLNTMKQPNPLQVKADLAFKMYERFLFIFQHSESWNIIINISNSMLNAGAKYRQLKQGEQFDFLKFWEKSYRIELECSEKCEKSTLVLKAEKLALGLYSRGASDQAVEVLTTSLGYVFNNHGIKDKMNSKPVCELMNDDVSKLVTLLSRLLLDFADTELKLNIQDQELQELLLELVLNTISKSSNPAKYALALKLADCGWSMGYQTFPIRMLRLAHAYFKVTGEVYEPMAEELDDVFALLYRHQFGKDEPLAFESSLIKAYTLMSISISQREYSQNRNLFQCLEHAVTHFVKAITNFQDAMDSLENITRRLDQFLEFLELQGIHELAIRLLQPFLGKKLLQKHTKNLAKVALYHRQLCESHLRLGYTGAAHHELQCAKRAFRDCEPIDWAQTLLLECEYNIAIENLADSQSALNQLHEFIQNSASLSPIIINGKTQNETSIHFEKRVLLYAKATCVFAKLSCLEGNSEVAAINAQRSVRFLQGFLKRTPRNMWPVISLLIDSMILAARMFEKIGVVREASYYAQEAAKLAESTKCVLRLTSILTFEGEMNVRMGKFDSAKDLLYRCEELMDGVEVKDLNFLQLVHSLALYLQRQCLFSEEHVYYNVSEQAYSELIERQNGFAKNAGGVEKLTDDIAKLNIKSKNNKKTLDTRGLDAVHNNILRSRVYSLGLQDEIDGAMEILASHNGTSSEGCEGTREAILFAASKARNYYLMAKKLLTLDPVYNVIQDSALSIPSADMNTPVKKKPRAPSRNTKKSSFGEAVEYLVQAKNELLHNRQSMLTSCSSIEIADISNLLNNVAIMLNAVSRAQDVIGSMTNFSLLELSKGVSSVKDRQAMTLKKNDYDWPSYTSLPTQTFEPDFLTAIPKNWLVVSINLSNDSGNLIISRFTNGQQPFMISLPLNRHSSRDADEDSFSFDDGLNQLNEIITASNTSAHINRTSKIKTKEERQEWWEERYALDRQLQGLLHDVEYCWLGGFRGIFDTFKPSAERAARFREQFDTILHSHLPSRYKKNSNTQVVNIHARVYELFMGLGNPDELSDPGLLEDLIYFVLDILQFHGEQNAYDELDMDQMVVEVEELVRGYHNSRSDEHQFEHTVLVLDKKCRQFPWESIPLLRNTPVSRVPSFNALTTALQSNSPVGNKFYYILNPGRDLFKTQERFQSVFESSTGWTGKAGEPPTEDELATALEESDVVVYMGHGGGEQYIRSAKIKSLNRCCPTLLLGCSSGALEFAGDYESWGTPVNYMVAGCPMLVANMWDVTDKDTDKFSMKLLQQWGAIEDESDNIPVDMSTAVMKCRDECTLKYLNGSAPVVYGLPLKLQR